MIKKTCILIFLICYSSLNLAAEKSNLDARIEQIANEEDADSKMCRLMLLVVAGSEKLNKREHYMKLIREDLNNAEQTESADASINNFKKYLNEIVKEINPNNPEEALNNLKTVDINPCRLM